MGAVASTTFQEIRVWVYKWHYSYVSQNRKVVREPDGGTSDAHRIGNSRHVFRM